MSYTLPTMLSAIRSSVLVLGLAACGPDGPVRIGVVLGPDGNDGAHMAADSVNASGGIRGRRLELVVLAGNWGTSAQQALIAADSLARDASVLAVVGHTNSSSSLAASQVYNAARVVQIAPTSTAPLFRTAGPYSFRMVPSDEHQAPFLANVLLRSGGRRRTAVVYVNDDYGRSLRDLMVRILADSGTPIVYDAPYVEGDEFRSLDGMARAFEHARPAVLLWLGRAAELRRFLVVARRRVPALEVLGSDGVGSACCTPDVTPDLQGVVFARILDQTGRSPALVRLRAALQSRTGIELTDQAAFSYDAVMLLASAMRSARRPDRESVRHALERIDRAERAYAGASGAIWFDKDGDPPPQYFLDTIPPPNAPPVRPPASRRR